MSHPTPRTGIARLLTALLSTVVLLALALAGAPARATGTLSGPSGPSGGPGNATYNRLSVDTGESAPDFFPAARPRTPKAPKPKGVTKTLVVQIYWDGVPATDDSALLNQIDLADTNTWFRTVSHGKYGVAGTVTRPLHVKRFSCGYGSKVLDHYQAAATKAAKHAGYKLKHYRRLVISIPCLPTKFSGLGDSPGKVVWLFHQDPPPTAVPTPPAPAGAKSVVQTYNAVTKWWAYGSWKATWSDGSWETYHSGMEFRDPVQVPSHEMGHNLGLMHAHLWQCSDNGVATSFSGHCTTVNYGDPYDTMGGDLVAGSYSAPSLKRLHWLPGKVKHVKKRQATVGLAPLEGTGGTQAITVQGKHGRTYWIELRTQNGVDAPYDPAQLGVLVHFTKPHNRATWLVDANPGSSRAWDNTKHLPALVDRDQSQLLAGHTLTTPEGIRITTLSQDGGSAVVQVLNPLHKKKHHHKKKHRHHKHRKH